MVPPVPFPPVMVVQFPVGYLFRYPGMAFCFADENTAHALGDDYFADIMAGL
jgi:hypothetical protein